MRTLITALFICFTLSNAMAQDLIKRQSAFNAEESMTRLKASVGKRGLKIFNEVNHSGQAAKNGMQLSSIKVLMFGNPKMGTQLMQADPRIGLELPMKIIVYENQEGVFLSYRDPQFLADQYDLGETVSIIEKMKKVLAEIAAETSAIK